MKTREAYSELAIQLARIEDKLDKLLSYQETECTSVTEIVKLVDVPEWKAEIKPKINPDPSYMQCYFDLHPEDRFKAISVSCPCTKCSAYSTSSGSVQSVSSDAWKNTITGKLQE